MIDIISDDYNERKHAKKAESVHPRLKNNHPPIILPSLSPLNLKILPLYKFYPSLTHMLTPI